MLSEKTGWTRCTLVERVFLFYPEEDREDEEETLLKLLYELETKGEGMRRSLARREDTASLQSANAVS